MGRLAFAGSLLPRLRRLAFGAGCAVLCCLPWTVRNYVEFHKFIPMRSALGLALYLQNNDNYDDHPRLWPFNVTREREYLPVLSHRRVSLYGRGDA